MKTNILMRVFFCTLFIVFLIPVSNAFQQYSCFDFDPIIYGKSVQSAVSQDGNFIIAGSPDSGIINLFYSNGTSGWSYQTGDNITSVAISSDAGFITAATYHGNLYYLNNSGKLLWNHSGFGCNNKVELSNDGLSGFVFNSGTKDSQHSNTTFYFDFNGTILWRKSIPHLSVTAISSDAKHAFLGTRGRYGNDIIMISDDGSEEWRKKMEGTWRVSGAVISDDGTTISASTDKQIAIMSEWGMLFANITPKYMVRSIGISPDGSIIAAGTQYQLICFNKSGMTLWDYPLDDYVYHIKFSQNGENLVVASGNIVYYFKRNGTFLWKTTLDSKLDSISISQNGEIITVGMYDNSFVIIDQAGNITKIHLGSIPAIPMPPAEPFFTIQSSHIPDNRSGSVPVTRHALLSGILSIMAICSVGIFLFARRKIKQ